MKKLIYIFLLICAIPVNAQYSVSGACVLFTCEPHWEFIPDNEPIFLTSTTATLVGVSNNIWDFLLTSGTDHFTVTFLNSGNSYPITISDATCSELSTYIVVQNSPTPGQYNFIAITKGGILPYTYIWDTGETGHTLTAGNGMHQVTVKDATWNCQVSAINYSVQKKRPQAELTEME